MVGSGNCFSTPKPGCIHVHRSLKLFMPKNRKRGIKAEVARYVCGLLISHPWSQIEVSRECGPLLGMQGSRNDIPGNRVRHIFHLLFLRIISWLGKSDFECDDLTRYFLLVDIRCGLRKLFTTCRGLFSVSKGGKGTAQSSIVGVAGSWLWPCGHVAMCPTPLTSNAAGFTKKSCNPINVTRTTKWAYPN
jgi:hypothetical protein